MEKNEQRKYALPVNGELVPVTEEIYKEFYRVTEHEKYLYRKDLKNGLISYDDWKFNSITNKNENTEDLVLKQLILKELKASLLTLNAIDAEIIDALYNHQITEASIAKKLGVKQQTVHKRKKRILKDLFTLLEKFI